MNGEKALEILKRPFHSGTLVINCVVHTRLDWHDRPRTCDLCWADMGNHISYCCRVNDFLNERKEEAIKALSKE